MGYVLTDFHGLNADINKWTKFFKYNDVEKVRLLRSANTGAVADVNVMKLFEEKGALKPGSLHVFTYLGFKEEPFGWFIRSLDAKEFNIVVEHRPVFYVAQAFEDKLSAFRYGLPIVMVEGILDAEALVRMSGYPYVFAYLSSKVSLTLGMFTSLLTDKVVIVPDFDRFGKQGGNFSRLLFRQLDVECCVVDGVGFKDIGDLFFMDEAIKKQFLVKFKLVLSEITKGVSYAGE